MNPGYAIRIDGGPERESAAMLDFLFQHQLQPQYRYVHRWMEYDVLIWDDLCTLHNAWPDYGPDEHRLIKRCRSWPTACSIPHSLGKLFCNPLDRDEISVLPRLWLCSIVGRSIAAIGDELLLQVKTMRIRYALPSSGYF